MKLPQMQYRHTGVYAFDVDTLVAFYQRWLGLVVSDRGRAGNGDDVAFMTADADEHHQVVFANLRQKDWPGQNQISFRFDSLAELKRLALAMHAEGVPILQQKDHGNAWSLYVSDPEGNRIELYTPTPWYVPQPTWWPLNLLTETVEQIVARTQASAQAHPGYLTREARTAQMQVRIDAARERD